MNEFILFFCDIVYDVCDWFDLQCVVVLLEVLILIVCMVNLVGMLLEFVVKVLFSLVFNCIYGVVQVVLFKLVQVVLWSMDNLFGKGVLICWYKLVVVIFGVVGGVFGFVVLFIELLVLIMIMMCVVVDVVCSEGFDLFEFSICQVCLEVFVLGGNLLCDDVSEMGYYLVRGFIIDVMCYLLVELVGWVVIGCDLILGVVLKEVGKLLVKMVEKVVVCFGVVVIEKFVVQVVLIVGVVVGVMLNIMFIDYYQDMVCGYFIVWWLELKYGEDVVCVCYDYVVYGVVKIELRVEQIYVMCG